MAEILKTVMMIFVFIGTVLLALRISGWQIKKACDAIIGDLTHKKAFDPTSSVELPYAKGQLVNISLRDYRPKALEELLKLDVVRMLEGGRYYLREGHQPGAADDGAAL
jgi:hypothetical protein